MNLWVCPACHTLTGPEYGPCPTCGTLTQYATLTEKVGQSSIAVSSLQSLIAQWREKAAADDTEESFLTARDCADQLEALIREASK